MVNRQQFGGDWTTEKLDRLRKYLRAYTTILSNKSFKYAYIDAFAGTGYRAAKGKSDQNLWLADLADIEPQRFLQGSARIALECHPSFHKYIFIEKSEEKLSELKITLFQEFPEKRERMEFLSGDANTKIQILCEKDWRFHRAVLFLDPFGMQVAWRTVTAIAKTRAIDLWILFPLGVAVNRMLTKDGEIDKSWRRRLDEMFGSSDWFETFYKTDSQTTLFNKTTVVRKAADFSVILAYYVNRLKTVFPYVAENPLQLYNSRNNPLYALFFAAGNPKGGKIAVEIAQHILGH